MKKKQKKFQPLLSGFRYMSDLKERKVTEFENEKIIIMNDFIKQNESNLGNEYLKFSSKLKK